MATGVEPSETAHDQPAEQSRKTWVKPEILVTTLAEDAEAHGTNFGDGLDNLS